MLGCLSLATLMSISIACIRHVWWGRPALLAWLIVMSIWTGWITANIVGYVSFPNYDNDNHAYWDATYRRYVIAGTNPVILWECLAQRERHSGFVSPPIGTAYVGLILSAAYVLAALLLMPSIFFQFWTRHNRNLTQPFELEQNPHEPQ